jgi:hypothetical protein
MKKQTCPCPECKGNGFQLPPNKATPWLTPRDKCTECNGTGVEQQFQMVFWPHDQFPYVLASRGFLQDDGLCYCPAYLGSFQPIRVMPLEEGQKIAHQLDTLTIERVLALASLNNGFAARRDAIAPWAKKA